MRLFKRRSSDPNPQLEHLSTLSEKNCTEDGEEASKSYLSAWGRTWDKLKRGDSSEQLPSPTNKKKMWYPLKKHHSRSSSTSQTTEDKTELKLSQTDLRKIYDMYRNMNDTGRSEKIIKNKRKPRCISDNLELSQQQLLDYLILMKPDTEELDKIFSEISEKPPKNELKKLGIVSEERRSRTSKFKSMFSRSSSKSDDEGDIKLHPKNSSTDSLTSLINFIIPGRRSNTNNSPKLTNKINSDESGYGSDSTKTITSIDSPVGSIKSQISVVSIEPREDTNCKTATTSDYYNEDTDTADEHDDANDMTITNKFFRKPSKKRSRSKGEENEDTLSLRKSFKFKRSFPKNKEKLKISIEDLSQNYCDKLKLSNESIEQRAKKGQCSNTGHLEKEYKCVKLKIGRNEHLGIKIGPNYGRDSTVSYSVTDILPNSVASRNAVLKIGDEVVKVNGRRIKGCTTSVAKNYLEPKNGDFEIICRTYFHSSVKPVPKKMAPNLLENTSYLKTDDISITKIPLSHPKREAFHDKTEVSSFSAPRYNLSSVLNINSPRQKKFVGLSDILNSKNDDLESKVTYTEPSTCDDIFKKPSSEKRNKHAAQESITGMRKFSLSTDLYPRKHSDIDESIKIERKMSGFKTVEFHKGPGCKSLGFSIVGGKDSPKGPMGVYIKTVFQLGQAADSGIIREGDEIISVNDTSFRGLSHHEAVTFFKSIKSGKVVIELIARHNYKKFSCSL